jgi:hypothetical protein
MPAEPTKERLTLAVEDLQVGMVLAESIRTTSGSILLAEGETLREDSLARVLSFNENAVLQTRVVAIREPVDPGTVE